jgi:hypothetical protein
MDLMKNIFQPQTAKLNFYIPRSTWGVSLPARSKKGEHHDR